MTARATKPAPLQPGEAVEVRFDGRWIRGLLQGPTKLSRAISRKSGGAPVCIVTVGPVEVIARPDQVRRPKR